MANNPSATEPIVGQAKERNRSRRIVEARTPLFINSIYIQVGILTYQFLFERFVTQHAPSISIIILVCVYVCVCVRREESGLFPFVRRKKEAKRPEEERDFLISYLYTHAVGPFIGNNEAPDNEFK